MKSLILGNKWLQKVWWYLYKISLKGLNYDRGHIPSANGEPFALNYVVKKLHKKDFILFDVGANRGQYLKMSLEQLKKHINVSPVIYCFEPQKSAISKLEAIRNNSDQVHIFNLALGSSESTLNLYKDSEQSEFASLYPANYLQYNKQLYKSETIKVDTLDSFCKKNSVPRIDFLKIDVEGHEIEVLKGAKGLISEGKINFIQFEFGLASIESRIFLKDFFLLLNMYNIYRLLPRGLEKINYSEYCELFLTTNYLAIRK